MKPKLTLVGAGPGDAELITLKGLKALKAADVILYDALANAALLDFAPLTTPTVYVGKRAGKHGSTQNEINRLIVESAFRYGHVVRLKGGDPFVFGRAQEELDYARSFGIECNVVPGVSSCIAVPELRGIPVTSRGVSESFWVLTGTTKDHQLSPDVARAAESNATVVILMGLRKLPEITALFTAAGKAAVPVAIIQDGSTPREKMLLGTVADIAGQVTEEVLRSPAVIVIGEVVRLSPAWVVAKLSEPQIYAGARSRISGISQKIR
jgi:uroporphyrin-III C-methyltransferase